MAEPRFQTCADIAREAARLLDDGHSDAARLLHARVAETCVFGPVPCPSNSECRELVLELQDRLGQSSDASALQRRRRDDVWT